MSGTVKNHLLKSIKIALAALAAIFIAGELGLKYSATAGIITVLSIRNTKRETLRSAAHRGMAYLCALALGAVCFETIGYTLPAFAVYLLLFAFLCMTVGWQEAIATDSVLITHFLGEGHMGMTMLGNETALFVVGTGLGILVNMHLHRRDEDFARLSDEADGRIKELLRQLAVGLEKGPTREEEILFAELESALERAKLCAAANFNNSLLRKDTYQLDYIRMRERQAAVLRSIYDNICRLQTRPAQTGQVAALFLAVEQGYYRENTVEELLGRMAAVFQTMRQEKLPECRAEFEDRAILFYILMQMEELLVIKRRFIESVTGKEEGRSGRAATSSKSAAHRNKFQSSGYNRKHLKNQEETENV